MAHSNQRFATEVRTLKARVAELEAVLQRAPVNSRYKDWHDEAAAVLAQATDEEET